MKKALVLMIIMAAILPYTAFGLPTAAVISASAVTHDKIDIDITTVPTEVDTAYVCTMIVGGADTTFFAIVDSTAVSFLLTGLTERTPYKVFHLTRNGDGDTAISNVVTDATYKYSLQDEDWPSGKNSTPLYNASSWLRNDAYRREVTTWSLTGSGQTGWSTYFRNQKYTGIEVVATSAADSVSATLYFYQANLRVDAFNDTTVWVGAVWDSLQVGQPGAVTEGTTGKELRLPPFKSWIVKIATYVGNADALISAVLTRDDDKVIPD